MTAPRFCAATLGGAALALSLAACAEPEPTGELVQRSRLAMGSQLTLTAWTNDEDHALSAFEAAFAEFDRLEALMSIWRDKSDVQRINDAAGQAPVAVSPEVIEVLLAAQQVSEWTGGKFDITFAALADVWKFDHDQDNRVPAPEDIQRRIPLVDYTALEVDPKAGTAFLTHTGMRVHLGGIGKGYAVERAMGILRSRGIRDFMIQSGGDLYVGGLRDGQPWPLGINDPRGTGGQSFATVVLTDATLSTSGDYERFFFKDGRRYHHIIDPDLGEPARGCRSVTIIAPSPLLADGLSTGVFILGPEAGLALVEKLPDVEAVIVTADNQVVMSSGLKDRIAMTAQPTDKP